VHLLATTSGVVDGAAEAFDIAQPPGDIVILSAADSELACLARASDRLDASAPSVRLVNLLQLQHNLSVDTYIERTAAHAKLIIVRLLGGRSYWTYGIDSICNIAAQKNIRLAVLPGGKDPDSDLQALSTLPPQVCETLRQYISNGGPENAYRFLEFCNHILNHGSSPLPPENFPNAGTYAATGLLESAKAKVGIVFYRSVVEGGLTSPIDCLASDLKQHGLDVSAIYVTSLKDRECSDYISAAWEEFSPDVIINATAFAVGNPDADPLVAFDCPVIQVAMSGSTQAAWQESMQGLGAKDLAMSVVLPELDGRIFSRAISFKADLFWHERTQCRIITYSPEKAAIARVAELTARWARLRKLPNTEKKVAVVLANYPEKDGRIANGVGYDTPASTVEILRVLHAEKYTIEQIPHSGNILIEALQKTRRLQSKERLGSQASLSLSQYVQIFEELPKSVRSAVCNAWGEPAKDPTIADDGCFKLPVVQIGNVSICVQPARGYGVDPQKTYHDPALVPTHAYLACYFWIRHAFNADAIIHNGKHGNLEWLPGKALSLSAECYPSVALGCLPQLYPFIVNDPGEGTQAKRRTSAVIVDHLTPPLTRAETYGPLRDLETLADEYYLASGLDPRRASLLKTRLLQLTRSQKIDQDAGFTGDDDQDLLRLDSFLCDLKEAQIRDGLHILGHSPNGSLEIDYVVALARTPRGIDSGADKSLLKTLAEDLALDFNPLDCNFANPWTGKKPSALVSVSSDAWRTCGDTVERLELLAKALITELIQGKREFKELPNSAIVLFNLADKVIPKLRACGPSEFDALIKGLSGRFVSAGPSGAPTRGRTDVLPTGKNFFSIDNRTLPTPAAWELGQRSATALLTRHFQDHGEHLTSAVLSAWGTSNMRTGGDDIAQAMALLGVRPVWEPASGRITGFEVIPIAKLDRPRVDITLRISGFFRDAFPLQIELLDKSIRAVAVLEEDAEDNPIADRFARETLELEQAGMDTLQAQELAGCRIFGSKPGAYGAGLQAMIDEKIWNTRSDLAAAFIAWGAYSYGVRSHGEAREAQLRHTLSKVQAVIHNQDNREHDLLDSDDYYQFEGGLSATVEALSGRKPRVYHNDHSRPERPLIRTLEEEVARVVRSRVVNPKWIAGVKRHGYKGAFEIAATVDYMFAFAATADAVKSHHFDLAYEAFVLDQDTKEFIEHNNPKALAEIACRLEEAISRGLWQPKSNSAFDHLRQLQS
jgi:cobaltochelatase CobN